MKAIKDWKYKTYALHFILWSGLLLLNYFIFGQPGLEFDFSFSLGTWLVYLTLFYLNYSLFIPGFLFKKKYFLFGLLLLIGLAFTLYLKRTIDSYFFHQMNFFKEPIFNEEMEEPMKMMRKMLPANTGLISFDRFFMPGLLQLLLIILASLSSRFVKKWQDDEKLKTEIEKEKISTELLFLKQQINPHFLFNAINSIYSLSISMKPETSDAIIKLSSILRYMLYETDKQYVALTDEILAINNYIELQRLRLTNKVKLQVVVSGNVADFQIVPMIMLPLIENAFKHGIDNANDSFIGIMIEVKSGELSLTIINTIVPQTKNIESSGIGIKNIIRRLDLLYQDSYTLESVSEKDVFKVNLKIKLTK